MQRDYSAGEAGPAQSDALPASQTRAPIRRRKLYEEVALRIEEMIGEGRFAVGESLPSERELMEELGVGRSAVREALMCRFLDAGGIGPLRPLGRPASKKRQGAKSRSAGPTAGVSAMGISGWWRVRWRRDTGAAARMTARARRVRGGRKRPGPGLKDVDGLWRMDCGESADRVRLRQEASAPERA